MGTIRVDSTDKLRALAMSRPAGVYVERLIQLVVEALVGEVCESVKQSSDGKMVCHGVYYLIPRLVEDHLSTITNIINVALQHAPQEKAYAGRCAVTEVGVQPGVVLAPSLSSVQLASAQLAAPVGRLPDGGTLLSGSIPNIN
uniref:Uncharacterized protein n=1 Tax=Timema genevievae TaxID=629358 RepID=A0A7R9JRT1_TIMGE|nr:unnamed protein product [Timema genevievae]